MNQLLQPSNVGGGGGRESPREKDDVEFFFATEAQIKNWRSSFCAILFEISPEDTWFGFDQGWAEFILVFWEICL